MLVDSAAAMATLQHQAERPPSASPSVHAKEEGIVSHINDQTDGKIVEGELPSALAPIEALGLEDWRGLEKKLVKRLDLTLMPCLWVCFHHLCLGFQPGCYVVVQGLTTAILCIGPLHLQLP